MPCVHLGVVVLLTASKKLLVRPNLSWELLCSKRFARKSSRLLIAATRFRMHLFLRLFDDMFVFRVFRFSFKCNSDLQSVFVARIFPDVCVPIEMDGKELHTNDFRDLLLLGLFVRYCLGCRLLLNCAFDCSCWWCPPINRRCVISQSLLLIRGLVMPWLN